MNLPKPCAVGPHRVRVKKPCFYCGRATFLTNRNEPWAYTRDHVVPRSISNPRSCGRFHGQIKGRVIFHSMVVAACYGCNHLKASMSATDFVQKHCNGKHPINWELIQKEERRFEEWKNANQGIQLPGPRSVRAVHFEVPSCTDTSLSATNA